MTDAELTRVLAVYGAGISTLALVLSLLGLGWTIYRDVTDKGRLEVSLMFGRIASSGGAALRNVMTPAGMKVVNLSERSRVFITATNTGRRPITVAKYWGYSGAWLGLNQLKLRRTGFVITTLNLPASLDPGAEVTDWLDDPSEVATIRTLYASDTTGRRWRVAQSALRRLKRDIRASEEPSPATLGGVA